MVRGGGGEAERGQRPEDKDTMHMSSLARRVAQYIETRIVPLRLAAVILFPLAYYYVEHRALWALGFVVLFAVCGPVLLALFIALHLAHYIVLAWDWVPPAETFLLFHVLLALAAAWRGGLVAVPRGRTAEWKRLWLWERNTLFVLGAGVALSMTLRAVSLFDAGGWALLFLLLSCGVHRAHGLTRPRFEWRSAFLLLISVVLGLSMSEVGARLLFEERPCRKEFNVPHERYLYTMPYDYEDTLTVQLYKDEAFEMPVSISSQGLRDREYNPPRDNEFRIVLVGDSFTFGWGVSAENTLASMLEERLAQRDLGQEISVVNCGLGGYGPWQEYGLLCERGFPLRPSLVMLQTFVANDVGDTLRKENIRLESFQHEEEMRTARWRCYNHWSVRLDNWMSGYSRLHYLVSRYCVRGGLPQWCATHIRLLPSLPSLWIPPPKTGRLWLHEVDLAEWYDTLEYGWGLLQKDILAIRDECRARGIDFAAYNMPYPIDAKDADANFDKGTEEYVLDKGTNAIEVFFREAGIPYFSLLDAFRRHPDPQSLYFHVNGHLNEQGNKLVVDAMERFVIEHYFTSVEASAVRSPSTAALAGESGT